MMPLVKGNRSTLIQIVAYAVVLVIITLVLGLFGAGVVYIVTASIMGLMLLRRSLDALRGGEIKKVRGLFRFSILYLFGLFTAIMVDSLIVHW
jgi:protoheme IX farnesyltransferase